MRRQRFPVVLSAKERVALKRLAQEEGLSQAAVFRRLLHLEARRRDLLASNGGTTADNTPTYAPEKTQQEVMR